MVAGLRVCPNQVLGFRQALPQTGNSQFITFDAQNNGVARSGCRAPDETTPG
jgi:hypothetical protein